VKEGFVRRLQRFQGGSEYEDIVWRYGRGWEVTIPALSIKCLPARAGSLVRMIKRIRASDGCLGIERL
jgi:hypothetical protein